jgi:hypothetical protein
MTIGAPHISYSHMWCSEKALLLHQQDECKQISYWDQGTYILTFSFYQPSSKLLAKQDFVGSICTYGNKFPCSCWRTTFLNMRQHASCRRWLSTLAATTPPTLPPSPTASTQKIPFSSSSGCWTAPGIRHLCTAAPMMRASKSSKHWLLLDAMCVASDDWLILLLATEKHYKGILVLSHHRLSIKLLDTKLVLRCPHHNMSNGHTK